MLRILVWMEDGKWKMGNGISHYRRVFQRP